ncbi:diacylglycerol O-acyltransferase 2D-like isoform X1 [Zingiber officinale]|uniref:diacylglycerol O-acyltransferase 2D-like isoform X1 n=1 Tax=Zingiber officinale TaxID=94328 RepID=UPI001C4ADB3D|nr:diacylglycerol O-acyltransferase 2D-like isoform X1 [Zingiber officinale]
MADPAVSRPTTTGSTSFFHSAVALLLYVGFLHINAAVLLGAALLLPARYFAAVAGFLLLTLVIPVDDKSNFGNRLSRCFLFAINRNSTGRFIFLSSQNRFFFEIFRYILKHITGYFPITLHADDVDAFDPDQAYVIGYEPHSLVPIANSVLSSHAGLLPLPKIKVTANSASFLIPFMRHIWTWVGHVPVTRKSFLKCLGAGYSVVVVPGGVREMVHMVHDSEVAYLKSRKGFVKIAIETGRPLVPVFCFGQNKIYKWWNPGEKLSARIYGAIKFPPTIFLGRFGSPIPFRHPLHIVVGKPIEVKRNPKPTLEEVDEAHAQFVRALQELFEKYKARVGYPNLELRIL